MTAYHLFYADGRGSPGTDITFFDWPVEREQRGANSITRTAMRVAGALDFEDFEGQRLSLVDDSGAGQDWHPWNRSPVPAGYQIRSDQPFGARRR